MTFINEPNEGFIEIFQLFEQFMHSSENKKDTYLEELSSNNLSKIGYQFCSTRKNQIEKIVQKNATFFKKAFDNNSTVFCIVLGVLYISLIIFHTLGGSHVSDNARKKAQNYHPPFAMISYQTNSFRPSYSSQAAQPATAQVQFTQNLSSSQQTTVSMPRV